MDVRTGTAVQFLASTPVIGTLSLLVETPRVGDWAAFGLSGWIVLINSIGVFVLLNLMLRRSGAGRVSTVFFLTPATTAVLAWLVVGQTLAPLAIVGLAVAECVRPGERVKRHFQHPGTG